MFANKDYVSDGVSDNAVIIFMYVSEVILTLSSSNIAMNTCALDYTRRGGGLGFQFGTHA